ncbi:MAG: putative porin [Steroidobacteraceae bacterium]
MIKLRTHSVIAALAVSLSAWHADPANAQSATEIATLKAQLVELLQRLTALEEKQQAQEKVANASGNAATGAQGTAVKTADVLAQARAAMSFSGDVRYRNETFRVADVDSDRTRQRLRARLAANFQVNDTVKGTIGLATGGSDPRSSNQTLTDSSSRKDFGLDLAYVEWTPNAAWKVTGGKSKYVWSRTPSLFYDGDINPEGLAVNYVAGNFFAAGFYHWLTERALSPSNPSAGISADSNLLGGQFGWQGDVGTDVRLALVGTYLDFGAVEGYDPLFGGSSFGNTTTTSSTVCRKTIASCLLNDYNIVELSADLTTAVRGRRLRAYVDLAQNTAAERNPVAGKKLNTAYALGFQYGGTSAIGDWEIGALYQSIEKDALFGQFIDSDFGGGLTDADGFVLKGGYVLARNWTVNGSLFLNNVNNDVPGNVTLPTPKPSNPNATVVRDVSNRAYKSLQVDFNFKF